MGSHSGKWEKRKAKEAERYWRQKKEYDDRIARLESRRRQIMANLDPGRSEGEAPDMLPPLGGLKEKFRPVREALQEVVESCEAILALQHLAKEQASPDKTSAAEKKEKVLVFNSDGTPKTKPMDHPIIHGEPVQAYLPQVARLKGAAKSALKEIEYLVEWSEPGESYPAVVPEPESSGEGVDLEGMLDVLKSPAVADIISDLLTSLKK